MGKVDRLVTGLLAIIFCMSSIVKFTDKFDVKAHIVMKGEFSRFASVSPLTQLFKVRVDHLQFMKVYGVIEGLTGLFILIGPTREFMIFGCFLGIVLQLSVLQMMYMLGNAPFTMIPSLVCIVLLIIKIIFVVKGSEVEVGQRLKRE